MKAIIHIGHHKTGTTSLQAFLAVNWTKLLAGGILSPWVESAGAAWGQAQLLRGETANPEILPANVREPHNALAFRMLTKAHPDRNIPTHHKGTPPPPVMLRAIRDQIDMLAPDVLVFCSEVMSRFGTEAPDLIETFAEPISGTETALHVTLRRPDDHLVSWYGQQLWFGDPRPALSDPQTDPLSGLHFDYRAVIEPWLDHMPGIEPRLRAHGAMMKAGGSIGDFFSQWGLARPEDAVDVPVMNPSVPRALFPLMRAANAALPRPAARALGAELLHISSALDLADNADIEFFGSDRRAQMADRFAPIHDWLTEIAGAPMFDDIDAIGEVRPVSEEEAFDRVLDSLSADQIESFSNPKVRGFLAELKDKH